MATGFRSSSWARSTRAASLVAVCGLLACSSLLGIDDGILDQDAAPSAPSGGSDGSVFTFDAAPSMPSDGSEGGASDDAGSPGDDGSTMAPEAGCTSDPSWCQGRCDQTTDNCGQPIDCGSCEAGVACLSNVCGCMPDPVSTTCAGKQCGEATNNCHLAVNCGVSGSTSCPSGDVCLADSGACCAPNNAAACGNRCLVQATNNCGTAFTCPGCASGQVCYQSACCTPSCCGGSCIDNCGQSSQACCPATTPDSGSPPPVDSGGGSCTAMGSACTSNAACCTGSCESSGICVSSCGIVDTSCNTNLPCCYRLTCRPVLTPEVSSPSVVIQPSRCE